MFVGVEFYSNNKQVNGDTIMSLIEQYANEDISIVIDIGGDATSYIREADGASFDDYTGSLGDKVDDMSTLIKDSRDKTSDKYVSPTKMFTCHVLKNEKTDAITIMYFKDTTED